MGKPSSRALGKRKAPAQAGKPSKKAKSSRAAPNGKAGKGAGGAAAAKAADSHLQPNGRPKRKADQPKKVKLRDGKYIPIPQGEFERRGGDEDEDDLEDLGQQDEDLDVMGGGGAFLKSLDKNLLSRTTKETQRIHRLEKAREQMPQKPRQKLRIPSPGHSASSMSDYDINSDDDLDSLDDEDLELHNKAMEEGDSEEEEDDDDDNDDEVNGSDGEDSVYDSGADLDDSDEAEGSDVGGDDDVAYLSEGVSSGVDDDEAELSEEDDSEDERAPQARRKKGKSKQQNEEAEYEMAGRSRWAAKSKTKDGADEDDRVEVGRLPIKLPSGEVQFVAGSTKIALAKKKQAPATTPPSDDDDEIEESEDEGSDDGRQAAKMANQKGKFGRMGVAEIISKPGWKNAQKLEAAKEQIAIIGAEILAGGELIDNGPLLTRLSTFSLYSVPAMDTDEKPLQVPSSIRGLAFLSQLAVYKDLIPGYRIRELTAVEEAEKVRDEVKRLREGEKMLVRSYKGYLKLLENEIKRRTPLAPLSIKCMSELLAGVPHFNFSENIMGVLVGRLGRRTWDDDSDVVLQTFITVFKEDVASTYSQTLVRLIARMIKERKFQVHPNVLSCLLQLRLRTELDQMREGKGKNKAGSTATGANGPELKGKFKSETRKKWATKNQRKREKELKEVEKEMAEAEAEVDKEERAVTQTEILKNLFVLYFSIIKHPGRSPLLPAALEGITQFAHHINVDFFRDLLVCLRTIIVDQEKDAESSDEEDEEHAAANGEERNAQRSRMHESVGGGERVRLRLLAIVTAFELLSGQGESLNIDLSVFIDQLYILLRPLALDTSIEDPPLITSTAQATAAGKQAARAGVAAARPGRAPPKLAFHTQSTAALLFRALHATFFSRSMATGSAAPAYRVAAFAKRLAEAALTLPPATAKQALEFVRALMAKDAKLEGMLDTEERMFDGVYRPDIDDPQLANPFATSLWEAEVLWKRHMDKGVRETAQKLATNKPI